MVDLKKSVPEKDIEAFSLWGDGVRMLMSIPESRKNLRQNMVLYKRHTNIYSRGNYKGAPKSSQRKKKRLFLKGADSFSITSKALIFLLFHITHIRANGATFHAFCLYNNVFEPNCGEHL